MLLWAEAHQAPIKTGHGTGLSADSLASSTPQGTEQPGSRRQVNLDWENLPQAEFMLMSSSLHMFHVVKCVGSEMEMCSWGGERMA